VPNRPGHDRPDRQCAGHGRAWRHHRRHDRGPQQRRRVRQRLPDRASDLALEATQAVPGLAPDASAGATTPVPLPAGLTGSFYLLVVADGGQAVAEGNETNNVAARPLQLLNH